MEALRLLSRNRMLLTTSSISAAGRGRVSAPSLPPQPSPPLLAARLTCKLLQRVSFLNLPGELGVAQILLAHGRQHNRGVHGVHPNLGPRSRRPQPQPAHQPPTRLSLLTVFQPPSDLTTQRPEWSLCPSHVHCPPAFAPPASPLQAQPGSPSAPRSPCVAPAPRPWFWSAWSLHPWWSLWGGRHPAPSGFSLLCRETQPPDAVRVGVETGRRGNAL